MISILEHGEAIKLLQSARVARLACIVNGEPYIVPINFILEDDCLYSHSLHGTKINALRENPRACVQVDEIESDLNWRSVLAFGTYEEVTKQSERGEILAKLLKRFPMLTPVEAAVIADGYPPAIIVFRIRIDRITGISEG